MQDVSYGLDVSMKKTKLGKRWRNTIVMMWFSLSKFILSFFLGLNITQTKIYTRTTNSSVQLAVDTTTNDEVWHTHPLVLTNVSNARNVVRGSESVQI